MIINHGYAQIISAFYGVNDSNTTRSRELEIENYLKKFADNEIYYLNLGVIINNLRILISSQYYPYLKKTMEVEITTNTSSKRILVAIYNFMLMTQL